MVKQDLAYLGVGVYAGHDGYQVWLTVGSLMNAELIALEPDVLKALVTYAVNNKILELKQ